MIHKSNFYKCYHYYLLCLALENVELDENALNTILVASGGDMRKAVTYLQSAHQLSSKGLVTSDLIVDISARVPDAIMTKLWESISSNRFDKMKSSVSDIVSEGYPMLTLLSQFHDEVVRKETLSDLDKALISEKISQAQMCLIDRSSEFLQLCNLAAFVMRRVSNKNNTMDKMIEETH
jgi:replication factor C subunit 2/4